MMVVSLIDDTNVSVGDTCVLCKSQNKKLLDVIKLEKGVQGLITRGVNAGKIGMVDEIKEGTFILPKRVAITLEDQTNRNSCKPNHAYRKRKTGDTNKVIKWQNKLKI